MLQAKSCWLGVMSCELQAVSKGGEAQWVLLGILGRGVPPGSPNPDPISDQKISINFQWTKTLYQNNLNNITFFFTFFQGLMLLVICKNTKENFLWEREKTNVKFHKITSYT